MAVKVDGSRCVYCAGCVSVCPTLALTLNEVKIIVDDRKCIECGTCVKVCPAKALSLPTK